MKRTRPSDIKALLAERGIQPNRVLGQNFLIDANILKIILDSAHLAPEDTVLEIGPGLGVLTEHVLTQSKSVIAIEKDPALAAYLQEAFAHDPRLQLITADALEVNLPALLQAEAVTHLVSNLPYASGTRILLECVAAPTRPWRIVVMLQSDVAERIIAAPGSKAYGVASIFTQLHYEVWLRKTVSPTCFYPPPEVRSAIVECYRRDPPLPQPLQYRPFQTVVRWCFSQRRKQMGTILLNAPAEVVPDGRKPLQALERAVIRADQRPETVAVDQWVTLTNTLWPAATVVCCDDVTG